MNIKKSIKKDIKTKKIEKTIETETQLKLKALVGKTLQKLNTSVSISKVDKPSLNNNEEIKKLTILSAENKKENKNTLKNKRFYTSYSKMSEVKLITIGLASANRIRQWAEKTLPSGKVVGEVINANTLHHKTFKPQKGGLFCERIFGPLKDFECACGKKYQPKNYLSDKNPTTYSSKRNFCPQCDVEYTWSVLRRYQLGFIQLASPTTHVWFVKGNPSYISILLDMKKRHLEYVTYCSETLTLENSLKGSQGYTIPGSPSSIFLTWKKIMDDLKVTRESLPKKEKENVKVKISKELRKREKKLPTPLKAWRNACFLGNNNSFFIEPGSNNYNKWSRDNTIIGNGIDRLIKKKSSLARGSYNQPINQQGSMMDCISEAQKSEAIQLTETLKKYSFLMKQQQLILSNSIFRNGNINHESQASLTLDDLYIQTFNFNKHDSISEAQKNTIFDCINKGIFELPNLTSPSIELSSDLTHNAIKRKIQIIKNKKLWPSQIILKKLPIPFYILTKLEQVSKKSIAKNAIEKAWKIIYRKAYKKAFIRTTGILNKVAEQKALDFNQANRWIDGLNYADESSKAQFNQMSFSDLIEPKLTLLNLAIDRTEFRSVDRTELRSVPKTIVSRKSINKIKLAKKILSLSKSFRENLKVTKNLFKHHGLEIINHIYSQQSSIDNNKMPFNLLSKNVRTFLKNFTSVACSNINLDSFIDNKSNELIIKLLKNTDSLINNLSDSMIKPLFFNRYLSLDNELVKSDGIERSSIKIERSSIPSIAKFNLNTLKLNKFNKLTKPSFKKHVSNSFSNRAKLYSINGLSNNKIKFVNNIYCLSHRELWEHERDWQSFSLYYLAPTDFMDIAIPAYNHRVYDALFSSFGLPSGNFNKDNSRIDSTNTINLKNLKEKNLQVYADIRKSNNDFYEKVITFENDFKTFKGLNINTSFSGAGIIQKLLAELDFYELKKMDKQNRILLYELNKYIVKLKKRFFDKKAKKQLKDACKQRDLLIRRTKLIRKIFRKDSQIESMILTLLPVLPPDLRPIVKMGDQIAASDLNRLYQRIIYRNERLKKFLKDPATSGSYEMKYAQRLLQEAVDNLIQNGKSGVVAEKDSRGRALKSLSDILKGKQGRFRQYLLGKRVDYSGRSVIVVGPKLKIHECGIPKEMAIELYLPFLIKRILNQNLARTVVGAKNLIRTNKPLTWQLLREIMQVCPVLLNRAPTLHRLGFQAFQPKLIEGRAILIHPLVCPAFNADFDGDQMAVHVPITVEARAEAWKLMLSRNNILSLATGEPVMLPSQDMVLGCYYLTTNCNEFSMKNQRGTSMLFNSLDDVLRAYNQQLIDLHAVVWVKWQGLVESTNDQEQPLEIRINEYGNWQEINLKSHNTFTFNGSVISNFICTTPGKIIFNVLIKKCLNTESKLKNNRTSVIKTFEKQIQNTNISRILIN